MLQTGVIGAFKRARGSLDNEKWHINTAALTHKNSRNFGIFIMKIFNNKSDGGKSILKEIQHKTTRN